MPNSEVFIDRVFQASIERVWKAWTIPELILLWIGSDPEGKGKHAEMTVQPGGYFEITFCNVDGTEFSCMGKYSEVIQNKKLAFSWTWKNAPGVESFVKILFADSGANTTHMDFEHSGLGKDASHDYRAGWGRTFDKLDRVLSQGLW